MGEMTAYPQALEIPGSEDITIGAKPLNKWKGLRPCVPGEKLDLGKEASTVARGDIKQMGIKQ